MISISFLYFKNTYNKFVLNEKQFKESKDSKITNEVLLDVVLGNCYLSKRAMGLLSTIIADYEFNPLILDLDNVDYMSDEYFYFCDSILHCMLGYLVEGRHEKANKDLLARLGLYTGLHIRLKLNERENIDLVCNLIKNVFQNYDIDLYIENNIIDLYFDNLNLSKYDIEFYILTFIVAGSVFYEFQ